MSRDHVSSGCSDVEYCPLSLMSHTVVRTIVMESLASLGYDQSVLPPHYARPGFLAPAPAAEYDGMHRELSVPFSAEVSSILPPSEATLKGTLLDLEQTLSPHCVGGGAPSPIVGTEFFNRSEEDDLRYSTTLVGGCSTNSVPPGSSSKGQTLQSLSESDKKHGTASAILEQLPDFLLDVESEPPNPSEPSSKERRGSKERLLTTTTSLLTTTSTNTQNFRLKASNMIIPKSSSPPPSGPSSSTGPQPFVPRGAPLIEAAPPPRPGRPIVGGPIIISSKTFQEQRATASTTSVRRGSASGDSPQRAPDELSSRVARANLPSIGFRWNAGKCHNLSVKCLP